MERETRPWGLFLGFHPAGQFEHFTGAPPPDRAATQTRRPDTLLKDVEGHPGYPGRPGDRLVTAVADLGLAGPGAEGCLGPLPEKGSRVGNADPLLCGGGGRGTFGCGSRLLRSSRRLLRRARESLAHGWGK
ncbi:hypothetical protein NDU88_000836 [Pleurodeles waltl]|uniref:Uncharacterized protein n=1 Tax=Pleurodeles waltl TaxID=8319 RepID=A0AAV7MN64_PLEWA|nr:hypothetical protein NDU88_000836 [Pleurodeles waltl]